MANKSFRGSFAGHESGEGARAQPTKVTVIGQAIQADPVEFERDEAPPVAPVATQIPSASVGLPDWIKKTACRYGTLGAACALSVCIGFALGQIDFGTAPLAPQVRVVEAEPEAKKYFASTARRNEPLLPLVPFDELDPNIVELGRRLFHDPGLSGDGRIACASCHVISEGGDDGLDLAVGAGGQTAAYNTLTVLNSGFNYVQSWDGRASSLEEQVDGPINNPAEMNSSWERVVKYLLNDTDYTHSFRLHLGGDPTPARIRSALATYERSLTTLNSKFDQWLEGNENALSADEFGGYYLFKKKNCVACHNGIGVGGNMLQPLGSMTRYFTDRRTNSADLGHYNVTQLERDRYVFRVPQLRNVAQTAPYFHDGSVRSLEEAVAVMIEHQCGDVVNREDVRRITAFLKTLSGDIPLEQKNRESKP
jgi:cytochrome c peroxidase